MTDEERRKWPEHHLVHDYANLVSSGLLRSEQYIAQLLNIPTANSHAWHAFYINCRKMHEFFTYQRSKTYLTAQQFVKPGVTFTFQYWTDDVQKFMNTHMLHVGGCRVTNTRISAGADDKKYFAEFQGMWEKMLADELADTVGIVRNDHRPVAEVGVDRAVIRPL